MAISRSAFAVPCSRPVRTGEICDHPQFLKEKGCVKDRHLGTWWADARHLGSPESARHRASIANVLAPNVSTGRRKALGLKRPKVRNIHSVRNLNTLT
jgi:hypothetical protein